MEAENKPHGWDPYSTPKEAQKQKMARGAHLLLIESELPPTIFIIINPFIVILTWKKPPHTTTECVWSPPEEAMIIIY